MNVKASPLRPYSKAMVSQNLVFVSGQLPLNQDHKLETNFQKAIKQSLANLEQVLLENKSSLKKLLKVNVYLKAGLNLDDFNAIYASYLVTPFPARSLVFVADLPLGALVMIDAIAEVN
jgi:2-iminobutanoate/2-iminopropanoate deaminase